MRKYNNHSGGFWKTFYLGGLVQVLGLKPFKLINFSVMRPIAKTFAHPLYHTNNMKTVGRSLLGPKGTVKQI